MTALQRYTVRLTANAREDLLRLYDFLLEKDFPLAQRALQVIDDGLRVLEKFPFTCRKAADGAHGPRLRELVIPFGSTGFTAK